MGERLAIVGARLLTPGGELSGHTLLCRGGVIEAILPDGDFEDYRRYDANGAYLSPGFVDTHLHGGGGYDFMDEDENAFGAIIAAHRAHGTTAFLPTTLAAPAKALEGVIERYKKTKATAGIGEYLYGIHFEGPYLSPLQCGAQKPGNVRPIDKAEYERFFELAEGNIRRFSIAPELEGAKEFAEFALRQGVTLSIAHSNATFSEAERAFAWGYRHVTHLYSLTPSVVRVKGFRIAGLLEAAYYLDDMDVEIIADGCHLPNELLRLICKIKGTKHVALITDAMRAAGQDVQESFLGSADDPNPVVIEDGVAKLMSREAFAGSIATTDRLLRTMLSCGTPLCDAVQMLTEVPVRMMNIREKIGSLREGYRADLCLFDEDINISAVFKDGLQVI